MLLNGDAPAFANTPDPSRFFSGAKRGAVADELRNSVMRGDALLAVLGEVGSGKTSLCRWLERELSAHADVVYLTHPNLAPDALIRAVATELGLRVTAGDDRLELLRRIEEHALACYAQHRHLLLLVEEAQAMSDESLEELRLLTNLEGSDRSLMQVVLFAQPAFSARLASRALRSLADRIRQRFALGRFSINDTRRYLHARLTWAAGDGPRCAVTVPAAAVVHLLSHGRPRQINRLAQAALDQTRSCASMNISLKHVAKAFIRAREFHTAEVRPPFSYAFAASLLAAASFASGAWLPSAIGPRSAQTPHVVATTGEGSADATTTVDPALTASTQSEAALEATQRVNSSVEGSGAHRVAGETWLANADRFAYTIQLMFSWDDDGDQQAALKEILDEARTAQVGDKVFVLGTTIRKRPASLVTLGEFAAKEDAVAALGALPEPLKRHQPYLRRVGALQKEISATRGETSEQQAEATP